MIHRSLAERLVATAVGIALVAVAIGFAVHIILRVWVPLVIVGMVMVSLASVITFVRRRGRSW